MPSPISFLASPLTAAQFVAIRRPHELRTPAERYACIEARETLAGDIRKYLAGVLAMHTHEYDRDAILRTMERIVDELKGGG